jgi:putative ABC transport system permease protein
LLIRSFWRLQHVEPGFKPDHVLTMHLSLPGKKYPEPSQITTFYQEAQRRLQSLPGIEGTALVQSLPLTGWRIGMPFSIEGRQSQNTAERPPTHFQMISPAYFSVMKIPVLKGRSFKEQDRPGAPPVAIINQTMVRKFFKGEEPIGKRLLIESIMPGNYELGPPIPWEIVGVIGNVKESGLEGEESPEVYVPFSQSPQPGSHLVVRTTGDPLQLAKAIEHEIHSVDKDQPITDIRSMEQVMTESLAWRRFSMDMLGAFASIALTLATVGIYGVISYSVTQRTHEIGIRLALGASPREVSKLIIKRALILTLVGIAIGLTGAFALTRLMSSLLFDISATDPLTFVIISLFITGVALAASYIPAWRATKVDPIVALRAE